MAWSSLAPEFRRVGVLRSQIEHGARVDVYVSVAMNHMDKLERNGYWYREQGETCFPIPWLSLVMAALPGRNPGMDWLASLSW